MGRLDPMTFKLARKMEVWRAESLRESTSARHKTSVTRESIEIDKTLTELAERARDVIYPLATQRLEIDLDDGIKQNYLRFGKSLAKIPGVSRRTSGEAILRQTSSLAIA